VKVALRTVKNKGRGLLHLFCHLNEKTKVLTSLVGLAKEDNSKGKG
jgi:hypothetical protein